MKNYKTVKNQKLIIQTVFLWLTESVNQFNGLGLGSQY